MIYSVCQRGSSKSFDFKKSTIKGYFQYEPGGVYRAKRKALKQCRGGSIYHEWGGNIFVVTVGWSIYPIGYIVGAGAAGDAASNLNLVYNLADFVNKIAFGVVIWAAATADSKQLILLVKANK